MEQPSVLHVQKHTVVYFVFDKNTASFKLTNAVDRHLLPHFQPVFKLSADRVFDGHDSHECGAMICSSFSPDAKRAQLYVPLSGKNQFKYVWLEPAMDTAQPSFAATAQFWRMHMASSASSASSAETLSSTDTNMAMALPLAVREFPSGLLFYADKAKGTTFFVEAPTLAVSMGLPPSQPSTVHLLLWIGVEQSELIDDCIDYNISVVGRNNSFATLCRGQYRPVDSVRSIVLKMEARRWSSLDDEEASTSAGAGSSAAASAAVALTTMSSSACSSSSSSTLSSPPPAKKAKTTSARKSKVPDADSGDEVVAKKAPTKEWTDQEIEVLHDFVESLHLPAHEKLTLAHWKRAERRFEGRTHDSIRRKWETMRKQDVGGESDDDDKAVDAEAEEE